MVKKIIISSFNNVAVTLQGIKVQYIVLVNQTYQLNDIFVGKVQKIFSSINAAFIDLGQNNRSGFIHASDIKHLKRNNQSTRINDVIYINQCLLVQVIKEPTVNKGPRLTSNVHIHGMYVTLMPFCNFLFISSAIYDYSERFYLYSLGLLIKPCSMGLLMKSSASGVAESLILYDLNNVLKQWNFLQKQFIRSTSPKILYKDEDLVKRVIRDFYDKNINKIVVDSSYSLNLVYHYLKKWSYISPKIETKLCLYDRQVCILDKFNVKFSIKKALESKVSLLQGGYVFIQSYEALTVIDVNSGSFNKLDSSRDTVLRVNLFAAVEISYQLKLRNISGVIIIDFIDMLSQRDKIQLLEQFNRLLSCDDCSPQIFKLSELGLLELTRRRKRQGIREVFSTHLDNLDYSDGLYRYSLYSKIFYGPPSRYFNYNNTLNKGIRYLFFSKFFLTNRLIVNKFYCSSSLYNSTYFYLCDNLNILCFFLPQANYIVPIALYTRLTSLMNSK
uniref:Ribonuclease E n=1 Tax=Polysiphonia sertularioides TaxID=945028 RepID=A0A1Z1MG79_9FLOR|nr:ribonuclease E [Polysiphonia sertularioides]